MAEYFKYYGLRWIVLIAFLSWGYHEEGMAGVFYAFILAGIFLFIVYTAFDAWKSLKGALTRPNNNVYIDKNFNLNVERDVIQGTAYRHSDPTRPTVEDHLAMLETYRHAKQKGITL